MRRQFDCNHCFELELIFKTCVNLILQIVILQVYATRLNFTCEPVGFNACEDIVAHDVRVRYFILLCVNIYQFDVETHALYEFGEIAQHVVPNNRLTRVIAQPLPKLSHVVPDTLTEIIFRVVPLI